MSSEGEAAPSLRYVPCVKVKRAELNALRSLTPDWDRVRDKLLPLFELSAPTDQSRRSAGEVHMAAVLIGRAWGHDRPYLLDGSKLARFSFPDGLEPFRNALGEAARMGGVVTPVLNLEGPERFLSAVAEALNSDRAPNGLAIRLRQRELLDDNLEARLEGFLHSLELKRPDCDVIIDRGYLDPESAAEALMAASALYRRLPSPKGWRSITWLGGSFPRELDGYAEPDHVTALERTEWLAYSSLVKGLGRQDRLPWYGDYGIVHPSEEITGGGLGRPNLRYTKSDSYLVARGNMDESQSVQLPSLAKALMEDAAWCGSDFSPGDRFIHQLGQKRPSIGNAQRRREAGFAHHFVYIVDQLRG